MDRGAWQATVHRVAQSQTRLNQSERIPPFGIIDTPITALGPPGLALGEEVFLVFPELILVLMTVSVRI